MRTHTKTRLKAGLFTILILVISSCSTHRRVSGTVSSIYNDPVCGGQVAPESTLKMKYGGTIYYFESEECLAVFQKNPERYVALRKTNEVSNGGFFSHRGWWVPVMIGTMVVVMLVGFSH